VDVKKDASRLQEMLVITHGVRQVPVIVDRGEVKVGYGGT